ncbi:MULTISPECIES: LysE family translocator [Thalassospira]|jgi:threonine/homoserine/homoserine lactone efflux protein|uniref:Lysine transporter LysE n=2 Tax=Thalassospira TaxID=168934 RepID=A0A367W2R5_9PROT|nr:MULTISPECIES: LysE family translocator [Thalassospira]MDG4718372.1 LysE family translocator [Thalassospira sp. FZY0004]RCK34706.1 lysine transporter LysE [Thalassospira profundimaris]
MPSFTEIGIYLPGILLSYAALLVGLISPGPALLGLMGVSLDRGRFAGQRFALGIGTGSFSIGLLTLTGLSALLAAYADAMTAIRIIGGLYLLWMSYRAFRTAFRKAPASDIRTAAESEQQISGRGYYLRGLALHLTNPKAILTWIAIISIGFHDGAPMWVGAAIVIGCGILSTSIHLLYATAFSTAPAISLYRRAANWINAVLGVFFAIVGIRLLFSR